MSAQSIAKAAQGYEPNPVTSTCGNCARFASEMALADWMISSNVAAMKWGAPTYSLPSNGVEKTSAAPWAISLSRKWRPVQSSR